MVVDRAMLDADTQLQPVLEATLKVPPSDVQQNNSMRRMTRAVQHLTRQRASATKPKNPRFFYAPSASAANALQSSLSGVSRMRACVR